MKCAIALVLLLLSNQAFSDVSSKSLYEVDIKTNEKKEIAGKALILDYGNPIKPGVYGESFIANNIKQYGSMFIYKDVQKIKNPAIDIFPPQYLENHYVSNPIILVTKSNEIIEIKASDIKAINIKERANNAEISIRIFSDDEILKLTEADYQLVMKNTPYTFLVFDTDTNHRLFIYSYNNLYRERAELFRHVYGNIKDFNPRHISLSKVLLPGIIAIVIEYEAELI